MVIRSHHSQEVLHGNDGETLGELSRADSKETVFLGE